MDRVHDRYNHLYGSSSSDLHYSPKYNSDGFSLTSEDSKDTTWKAPRRQSRRVHKRRRVSPSIPQIILETNSASPTAPPQQKPPQPAPDNQYQAMQATNAALQLRVAALEVDYKALHAYVELLTTELQTLRHATSQNFPTPASSRGPAGQSSH